jgi:hypothetical protein
MGVALSIAASVQVSLVAKAKFIVGSFLPLPGDRNHTRRTIDPEHHSRLDDLGAMARTHDRR